jgi:hypothetical protein
VVQSASAISASIGNTIAPFSDFRMVTRPDTFHELAVVVPPVELHTDPMGMKLGSYTGLRYKWTVVQRTSAISVSIGQMFAPFSDGDKTRHFSRIQR